MPDAGQEKQRELFEEYQPKGRRLSFFKDRTKILQNKIFVLQFSVEKLILISICLMVFVILTYCFGVERGKNIGVHALNRQVVKPAGAVAVAPQHRPLPAPIPAVKPSGYACAVQIATYTTEASAKKGSEEIKKLRVPVYVRQSGKFYVLYAGDYKDRKQAEAALSVLKGRNYKDCIIRTVK